MSVAIGGSGEGVGKEIVGWGICGDNDPYLSFVQRPAKDEE
jgi:hypothetical protein